MRHAAIDRDALAAELAGLPAQPAEALRVRWRELYGTPAPARIGRVLLLRAVAHRLQEIALGGSKPLVRRLLAQAVTDVAAGRSPLPAAAGKAGTRLLRDWHGITHEVIVQEDGVSYRGQHYRSLSAVARTITGVRWSGPLFFGLKESRRGNG